MLVNRKHAMTTDTNGLSLQHEEHVSQLKNTSMRIALALLLQRALLQGIAVVIGVLQAIFEGVLPIAAAHILGETVYGIGYFFSFAFPAWLFWRISRKKEEYRTGFYRGRIPRTMPLIVLAVIALNFAAAYVNSYVITMIFPGLDSLMSVMQESTMTWYEIMMNVFTIAIVPALCEELLFRGVILSNLLPFGRTVAILGSGLLFGLMHENPLQIFYTSLMGVILGYVYIKTRSYWACVIIHFLNNSVSVVQSALVGRSDMLDGVAMGVELVILVLGACALAILLVRMRNMTDPEETGSFGVLFEPHADYAEYPVSPKKRVSGFFSPFMIVYIVLSVLTMVLLGTVFGISSFFIA